MANALSRLFGRKDRQQREATATVATAIEGCGFTPPSMRVTVNGDTALLVGAYKRALDVLAGSVARLPLRLQRLDRARGVYADDLTSPLGRLVGRQPSDALNAYQWMRQLVWQAFHDGDAVVYPRPSDGGTPSELVLVSRHSAMYDPYNKLYSIFDDRNGIYGIFPASDVLHFYFNTEGDGHGKPLWELGRRILSIAATGDAETLERFSKGGNVRGIVSNDTSKTSGIGQYGSDQIAATADDLEFKFRTQGRNIVGVAGDVKLTPFSMSSTDMQFLDTRRFAVAEIARLTGVPTAYLFAPSDSNYKAPEQADMAFLTQTLDGILCSIEAEFERKLPLDPDRHRVRFDREHLNSMDLNSYALYQQRTIGNGTYTVNDWRRRMNQPPVEGGDVVYHSVNLMPLTQPSEPTPEPAQQ